MVFNEFLYFLSFVLYTIIFYRGYFKRRIINFFTFYITMYWIRYLTSFILASIFNHYSILVDPITEYYLTLIGYTLIFTISILILFIITKKLFIKLLTDDGNKFTNGQFAILLFLSIVGFISLFSLYLPFFKFFIFSSLSHAYGVFILSSLSVVCVVFILVYLTRIKALHIKKKM